MQMRGRIDIWNTYIIYELLYHTVIWVHFSTWIQKFEVLATPPLFPFSDKNLWQPFDFHYRTETLMTKEMIF